MVTSNRKFAISTGLSKNFCKMGEVVLVQQNYQDYNIYDRRENLIEKTRLIRDKYLIVSDVTLQSMCEKPTSLEVGWIAQNM